MARPSISRLLASQAEGKALVAHPAFMGRDPVSVYAPGAQRKDAVISQREASRHLEAFGGDQAIDWVYDAISLYAESIAAADYQLTKDDGTPLVRHKTQGTPPDHEVGPDVLYKLLDEPNPYMLYDELISLLVIDLLLVGNAYWYKWNWGTPAAALYRLAPSHVKIVPGTFGPESYEYQPPGAQEKLVITDLSKIVHLRRPNPHSAYYGLGVIQGAGRSMDLELAITDTMASYYENKADPSLIVQSDRRVPRDVFNKLRMQLRARASGSKNSGALLLLESGLKASSLSASAHDAMFDALSKMSRDRVLSKFRVSPMLLGIMDESGGANKVSDLRREFDNYTLRPFMGRLAKAVTVAIARDFDVKYAIDYRSTLPADEATKVGESVAKIPGIKVREVRRQYTQFGIPESTGDSDLDEMVLNKPMGDLGPDGQPLDPSIPSGADPNLSSEPGRPPLPGNTTAIGVAGGKALADGPALTPLTGWGYTRAYRDQMEAAGREVPERLSIDTIDLILSAKTTAEGKALIASTEAPDNRLPGESRPDDTFAKARQNDVDSASSFIAAGLRDATIELERALLDHVEGKALKTSDIVSRMKKSPAWTTFKERVEAVLLEGARRAAQSGVMHSGLTPDDEIDYDEVAKSVIHRPDGLRGIVNTLKDRVAKRIKDARASDAERAEYESAVRDVISEWTDSQAVTIATTEAVHAYNEATLQTAEMSGVTHVFVSDGHDTDEPCMAADGSTWEIGKARENRLEHPNCRRAFLPLQAVA